MSDGLEPGGGAAQDLEDYFERAPCGYISVGPDGRISKANLTLANWLGRDRQSFIGQRFSDILNIAGKIYYETHFAPLLRMQGFFNEVALDLLQADGTTLPVLVNAVERRDEKRSVSLIHITVFNASDRRRYENELLQARRTAERASADLLELNRTLETRVAEALEAHMQTEATLRQSQKMEAIGQLTGGIAHDFNNMLAVIVYALNVVERGIASHDVSKYIAAAKDGAAKAAALVQRLLAFSRQQALSPEALNANQMVAGISEMLRRSLGEMMRLETVLAGGLWKVNADRNMLESSILNLAINARDAMPEGGRLTIETANCHLDEAYAATHNEVRPGQYVMIAVTDTGNGMTPEVMTRAFDPFFTTKEPGKGTGLGLSQVFGFVKQSGGHIKLYSELGHGTSVKLYLPRLYDAGDEPKRSEPRKLPRGDAAEVVLVVEDDEHVLALTAQMLRDLGYSVIEAQGAEHALAVLSAHPEVSLLYTDVVMPDMNGRRLAEKARTLRPDLKVIYTTGYTRNAIVHNGVLDPGVNYLQKPASLEQMAATVRTVLDADDP